MRGELALEKAVVGELLEGLAVFWKRQLARLLAAVLTARSQRNGEGGEKRPVLQVSVRHRMPVGRLSGAYSRVTLGSVSPVHW